MPEWRQIADCPLYLVSDLGKVRRIDARRCLRPWPNSGRYLIVTLYNKEGKKVHRRVHLLVLHTWMGPPPSPLHHGAHDDGDKSNNKLQNLFWKLPVENEADKKKHGTAPKGGKNWRPSKERIARIKVRAANGESFSRIARDEGLHRSSVSRIVRGLRRKNHGLEEGDRGCESRIG